MFRVSREHSAYGYAAAHTPALDSLAARGTSFDAAYTPAPMTLPAHATLFSNPECRLAAIIL